MKTLFTKIAMISALCSTLMGCTFIGCHRYYPMNMTDETREIHKLADDGNAEACITLSNALVSGQGVDKDLTLAEHWLIEAEKLGSADAYEIHGDYYNEGIVVYSRDFWRASNSYAEAAVRGNVTALNKMSEMLAQRGLADRYRSKWSNVYDEKERPFARFKIAASYLSSSQEKARKHMEELAADGYAPAAYWLYDYYTRVHPNKAKAAEWGEHYRMRPEAYTYLISRIDTTP